MKNLILTPLFFILISCGGSSSSSSRQQEVATPAANAGKVSFWNRTNGYSAAVFLPSTYGADPDKKWPLIISLYGLGGSVLNTDHTDIGGSRSGFIQQVWDTPLADTYPAIVIAPEVGVADSDERTFWNHDELRQLIKDAVDEYQVDENQIVATGNSAGGLASQELALRSKDIMAGIMPGAFEAVIKLNLCSVDDIPIWSFGNSSDLIFQPGSWKEVRTAIAKCDGYTNEFTLTVNENNCGHDCWNDFWARSDVQQWLYSQKRN